VEEYWGSNRRGNVEPRPRLPSSQVSKDSSGAVKAATPDLILENVADLPLEIMQALIFENIGGQEILTMSRHDLVNGQRVSYSPIKNLSTVQSRFNSQNIISITNSLTALFETYTIKLQEKLPLPGVNEFGNFVLNLGTGPGGAYIYNDEIDRGIVINVRNMAPDEQVDVQLMTTLREFDGTIY
jgi:hypothetical protein